MFFLENILVIIRCYQLYWTGRDRYKADGIIFDSVKTSVKVLSIKSSYVYLSVQTHAVTSKSPVDATSDPINAFVLVNKRENLISCAL